MKTVYCLDIVPSVTAEILHNNHHHTVVEHTDNKILMSVNVCAIHFLYLIRIQFQPVTATIENWWVAKYHQNNTLPKHLLGDASACTSWKYRYSVKLFVGISFHVLALLMVKNENNFSNTCKTSKTIHATRTEGEYNFKRIVFQFLCCLGQYCVLGCSYAWEKVELPHQVS